MLPRGGHAAEQVSCLPCRVLLLAPRLHVLRQISRWAACADGHS